MTDATTLKPCPFCGREAGLGTGPNYYFVMCPDCLASTNVILAESLMPTEAEAIAAWNTRQPTQTDAPKPDPLMEAIAEVDTGKGWEDGQDYARQIRAALDARGLEIRSRGAWKEAGQPWLWTYDAHLKGEANGD